MSATLERPPQAASARRSSALSRGAGVELLGAVHGSGYRDGAALVRRGDGQMVQLGPLMYALLECVDGRRDIGGLAAALSQGLERTVTEEQVVRLAEKLASEGLLAGSEHRTPPRRNPLLALRWKVLITNPTVTKRLTAPFTVFFRPWLMWPILAAFMGVFWFVLVHKGVASATAEAFNSPGLLLLVFALAVLSAGFHELGHAAACRYGGATPGGMGMGMYLVWPAFYTDVTDAYRLPRRSRLRVDLGGLYFNAIVAVITMGIWLAWHVDALLLLVALQVLQMVKQLSPVIRADGYHILSDATGVPDLYAHMGPTLRRLLPGHRKEPSALRGWARLLVTVWVLIVVPVLLSLMAGAILLFPKLATSAWDSGRHIILAMPREADRGQFLDVLASVVRLLALFLPVLGSALVTQKVLRTATRKARAWSRGRPMRGATVLTAAAAVLAAVAWAWWPSDQYQPIRAGQGGTLANLAHLIAAPQAVVRPGVQQHQVQIAPGRHLAIAMIPKGGATRSHPALFLLLSPKGKQPVAIVSAAGTKPSPASSTSAASSQSGTPSQSGSAAAGTNTSPVSTAATAFPFKLPGAPPPGSTQALAVGTKNGGVTYDVAYTVVTVSNGAPVTETNSAYAFAHCNACTTVAVSFQVILVIGHSKVIAPVNVAGALNYGCPSCMTAAIADQLVVTLKAQPPDTLLAKLTADLRQLGELSLLGAGVSPKTLIAAVNAVQREIEAELTSSGLETNPANSPGSSSPAGSASGSPASGQTTSTSTTSGSSSAQGSTTTPSSSPSGSSSSAPQTSTPQNSPSTTATTTPAAQAPTSGASLPATSTSSSAAP